MIINLDLAERIQENYKTHDLVNRDFHVVTTYDNCMYANTL